MRPLALSPAQQRRLEKLARDAGRAPDRMLVFVLRDGFEFCEWVVRESLASEASERRHGAVADEVARREARAVIARHTRRRKQAA